MRRTKLWPRAERERRATATAAAAAAAARAAEVLPQQRTCKMEVMLLKRSRGWMETPPRLKCRRTKRLGKSQGLWMMMSKVIRMRFVVHVFCGTLLPSYHTTTDM